MSCVPLGRVESVMKLDVKDRMQLDAILHRHAHLIVNTVKEANTGDRGSRGFHFCLEGL